MPEGLWVWAKILTFIVLLGLSGLISGSEIAYFSRYSPSNLAYKRTFALLLTILILNNLINSLLSAFSSKAFPISGIILSLILTAIISLFGELLPKRFALSYPKPFIILTSWFYEIITVPFSIFRIKGFGERLKTTKVKFIDALSEILYYSRIPKEEKLILAKLIHGLNARGYSVMVPLSSTVVLRAETPVVEAREAVEDYDYDYVPVYFFKVDEIIGFVKVEDIRRGEGDIPVMDLPMKKVVFVPIMARLQYILHKIEENEVVGLVDEFGTIRGFACKKSVEKWILHGGNILPLNVSLMEVFLLTGEEIGPMDWDLADLFQHILSRPAKDGDSIEVGKLKLTYKNGYVTLQRT
jgi:putative hemolysin